MGLYIKQGSCCNQDFEWSISWYFKKWIIDPVNPNKFNYKYYQDNNPKYKSYLCRSWLLYKCPKYLYWPYRKFVDSSKEKGRKKSPTNKNELINFIKKEWLKIPSKYDISKLIQSLRRHLQAVIDAPGENTKY